MIFGVCIVGAVFVASAALPTPASGRVAALAFTTTLALLSLAVGVMGLNVYELVRTLQRVSANDAGGVNRDVLATGIVGIVRDSGLLFAAAILVFLLGPRPRDL